jgi:hypothetical protein
MTTAVAAPDHDPRPIRMLVLEEAIRTAIEKLDGEGDVEIRQLLEEALDDRRDRR